MNLADFNNLACALLRNRFNPEAIGPYYDRRAKTNELFSSADVAAVKFFTDRCINTGVILEIAAGIGQLSFALAVSGFKVMACDVNYPRVKTSRDMRQMFRDSGLLSMPNFYHGDWQDVFITMPVKPSWIVTLNAVSGRMNWERDSEFFSEQCLTERTNIALIPSLYGTQEAKDITNLTQAALKHESIGEGIEVFWSRGTDEIQG